jgi:hypothetical protein
MTSPLAIAEEPDSSRATQKLARCRRECVGRLHVHGVASVEPDDL